MAAATTDGAGAGPTDGADESASRSNAPPKPAGSPKEKRAPAGGPCPVPEVLKFTSWWDEDREESTLGNGSSAGGGLKRRYVSLKFYCADGSFDVRVASASRSRPAGSPCAPARPWGPSRSTPNRAPSPAG